MQERFEENHQVNAAADALNGMRCAESADGGISAENADGGGISAESADGGGITVMAGEAFVPLSAALESLLFVADKPVDAAQLARALRIQPEAVEAGLAHLATTLADDRRGLRLLEQAGRYRLVTRPDVAAAVEEFLNLDLSTRLSGPALETLAVIAYRQPVTRAQIEAVRGVDCGGVLRTLVQRGLVEEVGRLEGLGRPIVYGITEQFMHHFGLTNLHELPPLPNADAELLAALAESVEVQGTSAPAAASA